MYLIGPYQSKIYFFRKTHFFLIEHAVNLSITISFKKSAEGKEGLFVSLHGTGQT